MFSSATETDSPRLPTGPPRSAVSTIAGPRWACTRSSTARSQLVGCFRSTNAGSTRSGPPEPGLPSEGGWAVLYGRLRLLQVAAIRPAAVGSRGTLAADRAAAIRGRRPAPRAHTRRADGLVAPDLCYRRATLGRRGVPPLLRLLPASRLPADDEQQRSSACSVSTRAGAAREPIGRRRTLPPRPWR